MIKLSPFTSDFSLQTEDINFMKVVTGQLNTGSLPRNWQSGTLVFCGTDFMAVFLRIPSMVVELCATIFQFCKIVIGRAQQIISAEQTIDAASLTAILVVRGVTIGWIKQGMDALELWGIAAMAKALCSGHRKHPGLHRYRHHTVRRPELALKIQDIYFQTDQLVGE
jgi:hypothetical protein